MVARNGVKNGDGQFMYFDTLTWAPIDLDAIDVSVMERKDIERLNRYHALVREKILEGVWGKGYFGDVKIVDVNIRRLRMKIEDEPSSPQHILTVWGYGYRWNA